MSKQKTIRGDVQRVKVLYPNGELEQIIPFKGGRIDGEVKKFYENGELQSVNYYENGSVVKQASYIDGVLDALIECKEVGGRLEPNGECKMFWKNGNLKDIYFIKGEKMNGECKKFYENGNLKELVYLKDSELDGECKMFYENGELKQTVYFENGRRKWKVQKIDAKSLDTSI